MKAAELYKDKPTVAAASATVWRKWLMMHHDKQPSVWLIIYNKSSGVKSITYPDAVAEALCFGWIDSVANKRDEQSRYQYFSQRKPKSNWSAVNKARVNDLLANKKMHASGMAMVTLAKKTGTWDALNDVEQLIIPIDMQRLLHTNTEAFANWTRFSPSARKGILQWILQAKKKTTRGKRIAETIRLAAQNIKANYPG